MYNIGNSNFTKNAFGPILFPDNIFDEKFLKEKESALSTISLDDSIPNQKKNSIKVILEKTNSKIIKDKNNRLSVSSEFFFDKKKSKRSSVGSYGSNIILITNKEEDDSNENLIGQEINKLLKDPKNLRIKKNNNKRRKYHK